MIKTLLILFISINCIAQVKGFTKQGFVGTENTEAGECSAQSTSSTYVTCFSSTLPANSGYMLSVDCTGIRSDNAEFGAVRKQVLVRRAGGGATLEGSVVTQFDQTGGAGWTVSLNVDTNDIRVQVKSPSETVNWTCSTKLVKKI